MRRLLPGRDWSRKLLRPLKIPGVMTLGTLADVRKALGHLPDGHREFETWQHVRDCLNEAASGRSSSSDASKVAATEGTGRSVAAVRRLIIGAVAVQRLVPPNGIKCLARLAAKLRRLVRTDAEFVRNLVVRIGE
jgi:hypothetical protein